MTTLKLFEGPLVSPSGLSFAGENEEIDMMRIVCTEHYARSKGISVQRANLTTNPKAFLADPRLLSYLGADGDSLPLTFVDGELKLEGRYPTNEEFAQWLGLPELKEGPPALSDEDLELLRMEAAVWGGCGPSDCSGCSGCGSGVDPDAF